ncbi:hypothetical protein Fmac_001786 [Flemingia macrophylla]|uniref:Disease resistance protein At4g27190-like leucine-rich repeats domain-containing protein n=1 Tax=Flemingia macrophylla TaxID=520843 RepID=A0ABD1NI37_9FABA
MPENSKKVVFIKLKYLTLQSLPSVTSFCSIRDRPVVPHTRNEQVWVFPKLEEIHLIEMNWLIGIWPTEVTADSFSGLISVYIERCKRLKKIFPCHLEGWFASLDKLTIIDCKSVEVIFEIKDSQQIDVSGGIDTNL